MLRNLSHLVKVIHLDGRISRAVPLMNGVNSSSILSCGNPTDLEIGTRELLLSFHSYFYHRRGPGCS